MTYATSLPIPFPLPRYRMARRRRNQHGELIAISLTPMIFPPRRHGLGSFSVSPAFNAFDPSPVFRHFFQNPGQVTVSAGLAVAVSRCLTHLQPHIR